MNTTAHDSAADRPRPEAGLRDASLHDLVMDCCRLGPAPTQSRELFVHAVTLLLVAIVFVIAQPPVGFMIAAVGVVALVMGVRWFIGTRTKWATR